MMMNIAPTNPAARHPAPAEAEVRAVDRQTRQAWMPQPEVTDARRRLAAVGVTNVHILEGGAPGVDRAGDPSWATTAAGLWNSTSARLQASWSPGWAAWQAGHGPGAIRAADNALADPSSPPGPLDALPRRELRSR